MFDGAFPSELTGSMSDGDVIDAELVPPDSPDEIEAVSRSSRARRNNSASDEKASTGKGARQPKTGPPSLDEWAGFFSRVVLRTAEQWYVDYAFRGIDESRVSEQDLDKLELDDEEKQLIVTPFSELAYKSKFMKKHGRMIVASGDAFNALVVIGAWTSRVNRVARKYRPPKPAKGRVTIDGNVRHDAPAETNGFRTDGASGGRIPEWFNGPVFPGTG